MRQMVYLVLAGILAATVAASATAHRQAVDDATTAKVKEAIDAFIQQDVAVKEQFLLIDPRDNEPRVLTYDHIHAAVEAHDRGYVACVDFTDRTGVIYDVDVVVTLDGGQPTVREAFVHMVDGTEIGGGPR